MKLYHLTFLIIPILASKSLNCGDPTPNQIQQKCDPSEYKEYISCVNRRHKRESCCDGDECTSGCSDCSSSCNDCDCGQCSRGGCTASCNTCCGNFVQTCETHYCCYRTCHAKCSSSDCRRSCRRSCEEAVDARVLSSSSSHQGTYNSTAHLRTELNIFNEINNTNVINVPVDVNTTSYNNITVFTSQQDERLDVDQPYVYNYVIPQYPTYPQPQPQPQPMPQPMPQPQPEPQPQPFPIPEIPPIIPTSCCTVATPQQCFPQPRPPYVSCYYQTQQVCGGMCQSQQVIHPHVQQVCGESVASSCQNEVFYSSQPRPTCAFAPRWPYFGCGVPQFSCSGCYGQQFDVSQCPDYCNGALYR